MKRAFRITIASAVIAAAWAKVPRRYRPLATLAAVALMVWAIGSWVSQATHYTPTTYYLDKDSIGGTCSDAYSLAQAQSSTTPFCTMDALEDAVPTAGGWRIYVRAGTYPRWQIDNEDLTDWGRIRPYPGESVTSHGIWISNSDNWDIANLKVTWDGTVCACSSDQFEGRVHIDGPSNGVRLIGMEFRDALAAVNSRGVTRLTFAANTVDHMMCIDAGLTCSDGFKSGYGISQVSGSFDDVNIVNNTFDDIDGDALQLGGTRIRIDHNTFNDVSVDGGNSDHADAIQLSGGCTDCVITRNVFTESSKGLCWCGSTDNARTWRRILVAENVTYATGNNCFDVADTSTLTIRNNVCWDNRYTGVAFDGEDLSNTPMENVRIYNNVFGPCDVGDDRWAPDCNGDDMQQSPSNTGVVSFHHNIIARNAQNRTYDATDIVGLTQGQLDGLFIDAAAGDFRPATGGLTVDAGAATDPLSLTDLRYQPRENSTVDIGAYERVAGDP